MKAKYDTDFFILDKFPLAVQMLILALEVFVREECTNENPEKVSEGSKMPNLYFGVLKRVKNGLKMAKNTLKFYIFRKKDHTRGGEGVW